MTAELIFSLYALLAFGFELHEIGICELAMRGDDFLRSLSLLARLLGGSLRLVCRPHWDVDRQWIVPGTVDLAFSGFWRHRLPGAV
jgi:hypothetical protein